MSRNKLFEIPVKMDNREDLQKVFDDYNNFINQERDIVLELDEAEKEYSEAKNKVKELTKEDIYKDYSGDPEVVEAINKEESLKVKCDNLKKKLDDVALTVAKYSYTLAGHKYYDKKRVCDNIRFFIREKNIKIGDIERNSGNTVGYMSRLEKDDNIKSPNFDFIVTAAKMFNISLDELLYSDPQRYTEIDKYINNFVDKLAKDTINEKLEWDILEPKDFKGVESDGTARHEMMSVDTFTPVDPESGYPEEDVSFAYFDSNTFGTETKLLGNLYKTRLKNGVYIYVMNLSKDDDFFAFATEIWLLQQGEKKYLCSNKEENYTSELVGVLERSLRDYFKRPRLSKDMKESIDAFMNDDIEDDFKY